MEIIQVEEKIDNIDGAVAKLDEYWANEEYEKAWDLAERVPYEKAKHTKACQFTPLAVKSIVGCMRYKNDEGLWERKYHCPVAKYNGKENYEKLIEAQKIMKTVSPFDIKYQMEIDELIWHYIAKGVRNLSNTPYKSTPEMRQEYEWIRPIAISLLIGVQSMDHNMLYS